MTIFYRIREIETGRYSKGNGWGGISVFGKVYIQRTVAKNVVFAMNSLYKIPRYELVEFEAIEKDIIDCSLDNLKT